MSKVYAGWNSQQGEGEYRIQFETNDERYYQAVQAVCRMTVDSANARNMREEREHMCMCKGSERNCAGEVTDDETAEGKTPVRGE